MLPVGGAPLVAHTIRHALAAESVDEVVVSTDDGPLAELAGECGARVVLRPPELAGDEATSEAALLHALDTRRAAGLDDPELVVFLQCTSPARRDGDIDAAVATLTASGADSVFSATRDRALYWLSDADGLRPANYRPELRLREQEMGVQLRENGSIYVMRTADLRTSANRLPGIRAVYEMDVWSSFQVDAPEDVELAEWILARPEFQRPLRWPERVDLVVFDFDGVMTDNTVYLTEDGDESVRVDRGDGWGIAQLRKAGVEMLVLSTEEHPVVSARARKLRIPSAQGLADKGAALDDELRARGIDPAYVVYLGNDENDLPCFERVGLAFAPADAHPSALAAAGWVLSKPGGHGAVRELCDLLLARY